MAYNFSRINVKCGKLAFLLGIMSLGDIVNFVKKIKRLFRKYGASNVNEAFFLTSV